MQPSVSRLLYRSLLRVCDYGKRPEVFSRSALLGEHRTLPSSASEVVARLRGHFERGEDVNGGIDPFATLRQAAVRAETLYPPSLPDSLPAFVLPSHTLLVGEEASFLFFEPRYLHLVRLALDENQGRFIHLPVRASQLHAGDETQPLGTLCTILRSEPLDDGRFVCRVLAGPRVACTVEEEEHIPGGHPPLVHAHFAPRPDDATRDPAADAAAARRCVDLLQSLEGSSVFTERLSRPPLDQGEGDEGYGLAGAAPCLDPERLSHFLCGNVLLPAGDMQRRMAMLFCPTTSERLDFVEGALKRLCARAAGDLAGPEYYAEVL